MYPHSKVLRKTKRDIRSQFPVIQLRKQNSNKKDVGTFPDKLIP